MMAQTAVAINVNLDLYQIWHLYRVPDDKNYVLE